MAAGTSPVFVLTRGPRLSLANTDFIGHDQVAFELLLNLLLDFVTVVQFAFEGALPKDCIPVVDCFLRWLVVFTVYLTVTTGLSFACAE